LTEMALRLREYLCLYFGDELFRFLPVACTDYGDFVEQVIELVGGQGDLTYWLVHQNSKDGSVRLFEKTSRPK